MAALLCQATHTAPTATSSQYRDTPTTKDPLSWPHTTMCKLSRAFFFPTCMCDVCMCLPRRVVAGAIVAPLWKRSLTTSPYSPRSQRNTVFENLSGVVRLRFVSWRLRFIPAPEARWILEIVQNYG